MAYIDAIVSDTGMQVWLAGLDSAYSGDDRIAIWYVDNALYMPTYILAHASASAPAYLYGLLPGTAYRIDCNVINDRVGAGAIDAWFSAVITTTGTARPPYFAWTYPKAQGGAFNLTAAEWNGLCANINEVRSYKGFSAIAFTSAASGQPFTAAMFNQARAAIGAMTSVSGIPFADSGAAVTAAALRGLRDAVNSVY